MIRNCVSSFPFVILLLSACSTLPLKQKDVHSVPHQSSLRAESSALGEPAIIQLDDRKEKLAELSTVKVSTKIADSKLSLSSTVEPPSDATGIVYSPVNGVVTKVLVDVGDRVKAAQIVAVVNSPDLSEAQSAALSAMAKLEEAIAHSKLIETRLEIARANEKRFSLLEQEGIASKRDVEAAKTNVVTTEAELVAANTAQSAARTQLESARVKLRALGLNDPSRDKSISVSYELPIRSPMSGIVINRSVSAGQSVGPATGASGRSAALLTIADLKKVWVMLEVPQSEVSRLSLGTRIEFASEVAPSERFVGTVSKLGENFDPKSRTVQVRTDIDNSKGLLKPGMLVIANANIQIKDTHGYSLPDEAIQSIEGRDYVFVSLPDHKYEKRKITCHERNKQIAWVDGVRPGEKVVSSGSFYLKTEAVRASLGAGE